MAHLYKDTGAKAIAEGYQLLFGDPEPPTYDEEANTITLSGPQLQRLLVLLEAFGGTPIPEPLPEPVPPAPEEEFLDWENNGNDEWPPLSSI